jgi:hypothetical protein
MPMKTHGSTRRLAAPVAVLAMLAGGIAFGTGASASKGRVASAPVAPARHRVDRAAALCRATSAVGASLPAMRAELEPLARECATGARSFDDSLSVRISVAGDFNGDGNRDALAYASGARGDNLWYGTTSSGFHAGASITVNGLYIPFVGDFNGDGHDDVLWWAIDGGDTSVWYGAGGATPFRHGPPFAAPPLIGFAGDSYLPAIGDFDHDGKSDIAWVDNGEGGPDANEASQIFYGTASGFRVSQHWVPTPTCPLEPVGRIVPAGTIICAGLAGDFNGDGRDDLLFYRSGGSPDALRYSTGTGFESGPAISVSGVYDPLAADFNGDGKTDVFWYSPGTAADYLWYGRASGFRNAPAVHVNGDYEPVVGDFNGDGKADVVWYAPGSGHEYLWYGKAGGFRSGPRIAVNGTYEPVVGDFNGDGKTDIVWFSEAGTLAHVWYGETSGFVTGTR